MPHRGRNSRPSFRWHCNTRGCAPLRAPDPTAAPRRGCGTVSGASGGCALRRRIAAWSCLVAFSALAACSASGPDEWIVGTWVIDAAAQREETARVSPSELADFDEAFRANLRPIRETFHRDGRYEIWSVLGGPFQDRWEIVSHSDDAVTIRSSGYSWIARGADFAVGTRKRSDSELSYRFRDPNHMFVTVTMPIFGETKEISYFFVRDR